MCSVCHYYFLSLHLLHFLSLPLSSVLCPEVARLVPIAHHSALPVPVSYCYIVPYRVPYTSIVGSSSMCGGRVCRRGRGRVLWGGGVVSVSECSLCLSLSMLARR